MAFGNILTNAGIARFLAASPEDPITITELVVGDGGGPNNTVNATMTELVNETWRGTASAPIRDPENADVLTFEAVVPAAVGGFVIREVGLYDDEGDLVLVGVTNEIDKPLLPEVLGYTITIRIHMKLLNSEDVELVVFEHGSIDHQGLYNRSAADAHPAASISVDPVPDDETIETAQDQLDALWTSRALSFDDLDAMAAHDTTAGGKLTGLVSGIGPYRWASGSALTADGYTVVDSDVSGQWVLEFGRSLSFFSDIDAPGDYPILDYRDPGMFKIHYDESITIGAINVIVDDALALNIEASDGKDFELIHGQKLSYETVKGGDPYGISGPSFVGSFNVTQVFYPSTVGAFDVSPDGTRMIICGPPTSGGPQTAFQYTLATPWLVSTASYDSQTLNLSAKDTDGRCGVKLSPDGNYLFYGGNTNKRVHRFSLPNAWGLNGAVDDLNQSPALTADILSAFCISSDGLRMFTIELSTGVYNRVRQWNLASAWDPSSAVDSGKTLNIATQAGLASCAIELSRDDTRLIVSPGAARTAYQYTMSTANELDTASYDSVSWVVPGVTNAVDAIKISADGEQIYVFGRNASSPHVMLQYEIAEPYSGNCKIYADFCR